MSAARDIYFEIVPEYSDPDTYVRYTISNGFCRASLQIYADPYALAYVATKLIEEPFVEVSDPTHDFTITDEYCMNIEFDVVPACKPEERIFQVLIVNTDVDHPYRTQIQIVLNKSDAKDLSDELARWVQNTDRYMIWKK
jgi:hypothetical protein